MKRFLLLFGVLFAFIASCSSADRVSGGSGEQNAAEAEIRASLCEIENGNFKAAQAALEGVLKKDPKNIYALRLLPGVAARQIKQGDKSPENAALVRKAVAAYENAAANPVFTNEREDINRFIIRLYGMIGGDEKTAALLKKAENESETPKQRAAFYTTLAADNYACANDISDVPPVKATVKRNGRDVYVFRKPPNPADFERLKACAAKGSELIGKATALDPASDTAWSYRATLYSQLARIAEMEEKPAEKARLMKEFDAARAKFIEISNKRRDEEARKDAERFAKSSNDGATFAPADVSAAELKEFGEELKSYRAERPLAETVERVDIPSDGLFELVAPIPFEGDEPPTEPVRENDENRKRELKTFSPEGVFSAELPDNADVSSTADGSRIYTASGNGLSFFILETARSRELAEAEQDMALNFLAWTVTKYIGNRYVGDGGWNSRFESELTRKDKLAERPARFYAYRMISCKEKKDGTMLFVIGRKKNYSIDIRGAGESDERVRRFLKSLKLD